MSHTEGPWRVGKFDNVVVADHSPTDKEKTGHTDVKYYGGYLIAESIIKKEDVDLIAIAPELLEACKAVIDEWHSDVNNFKRKEPFHLEMCRQAIKEAEGK